MDKPFATFVRFCVHDVDRDFVDDVEPTRVGDATSQLGRVNLRTPYMLDARMMQTGPKRKPNFWVWNALHNRLRELVDFDGNTALGD